MLLSLSLWQREIWRGFWRRPSVIVPVVLVVASLAVSWLLATMVPTQDSVILRYSIYVGTNWIANRVWIYLIPSVATLFAVANVTLAVVVGRNTVLTRQMWLWFAVAISLGFSWLMWLLYRINS